VNTLLSAHEDIVGMCKQISAENDPTELVVLIEKLRKVLAEEKRRIESLLATNEASRLRNVKEHPAAKAHKAQ
jgi:hypothetical protein